MKTTIIPFLFLIFFSFSGFAQSERGQKIKAMKTAFLTQELSLTPTEAEKFWPVYNKYDSQIWAVKRKEREEVTKVMSNNMESLSNSEATDLLQKMNKLKLEEHKLQQQMETELLKQISPVKLLKLRKAEHDFQMQLLKKYRGGKRE